MDQAINVQIHITRTEILCIYHDLFAKNHMCDFVRILLVSSKTMIYLNSINHEMRIESTPIKATILKKYHMMDTDSYNIQYAIIRLRHLSLHWKIAQIIFINKAKNPDAELIS